MRISPKYTVNDWNKASKSKNWQTMISIFEDRLRGRFLVPICMIEHYEFAGFAVIALDCLLIETLQQFYQGKPDSKGNSKESLVSFLTNSSFKEWFKSKSMAEMFYTKIRCGILHQAETQESSKITIKKDTPLVENTIDGKGLVINRKKFHQQLVKEFEAYLDKLKNPQEKNLRNNFEKKMGYICSVI